MFAGIVFRFVAALLFALALPCAAQTKINLGTQAIGGTTLGTALITSNGTSALTGYAGTSCTNQFPRSLSAVGAATCSSVVLTSGNDVSGILPSANGGTGIAFFTAAGPSVARVYTFPDQAATILYSGGPLGTPSSGTLTNATGLPLSGLATQATNTIVGNATSGTASPTALAIGSCSTSSSALQWTTNTGFGCNTAIAASTATTATNLPGGTTGAIPYQSGAGATALLAATATAGKVLQSGASAAPTWSTPTYPSTSGSSGKFLKSDGTNNVYSTATLPDTATGTGTILRADGTNWVASTPTYPNTATLNKILVGDATNIVLSTPTLPVTSAPTSGKLMQGDGTNWVASTPTWPTSAGSAKNVPRSDGTNFVSTQLAASDLSNGTTGSGSVVLAASPTLTGTVGIGAASAGNTLQVADATNVRGLEIDTSVAGQVGQLFYNRTGGAYINAQYDAAQHSFKISGTQKFLVDSSGNTTVTGSLTVNGLGSDATHTDNTVCIDTSSGLFYKGSGTLGICLGTSSVRYKSNIALLAAGLNDVLELQTVSFTLDAEHGDPEKRLYGFLAEQAGQVLPELMGVDKEGRPNTFDYVGVIPVLVNAIKEQQAEIAELRKQVEDLQGMRYTASQ